MKNNSKISTTLKTYLTLTFMLMAQFAYAQTDFRAGYVIDAKNDTLIGDIDYRGDMSLGEYCVFKLKNTENVVKYAPKDIIAYRFKGDRYFVSQSISGKFVFLEFLIKGKVNVYYWRNPNGDHYFIKKEGEKLIELPYKESTEYSNSKLLFNQSTTHIGLLIYYMQDAPKFQDRIAEMKKPDHDALIALAKDYHNTVCKDESCVVYKKKISPVRVNVEFMGGLLNYYNSDYITSKNHFTIGILAHIWLPRTNERLYFRTGILFSTARINDNTATIYKIPLQIEYIYPKGIVRPRFAYGINLGGGVGAMAGLTVKWNEKTNLSFNYDMDFIPNKYLFIVPSGLLAQTFSVGINVKW